MNISNIERYDVRQIEDLTHSDVYLNPHGKFVKFEDVEKIVKDLEEKAKDAYFRGWEDGMDED